MESSLSDGPPMGELMTLINFNLIKVSLMPSVREPDQLGSTKLHKTV